MEKTNQKSSQRSRYRIKFVNIHGIGRDKLKKIRQDLLDFESEYPEIKEGLDRTGKITLIRHLY